MSSSQRESQQKVLQGYDMMEFPISVGSGTWRWCQLLVFQRLESLKKKKKVGGSEFPELIFFTISHYSLLWHSEEICRVSGDLN